MSDEQRYNDILRGIEARKQALANQSSQNTLSHLLDSLNAMDTLDNPKIMRAKGYMCYGPEVFKGAGWVGAVMWRKPATYHGYKTLTLLGIWAYTENDTMMITVGTKLLPFTAPFYEPEAYHKLIKKGFDLYYNDDGSPPPIGTGRLYTTRYEVERRLEIRAALADAIKDWQN